MNTKTEIMKELILKNIIVTVNDFDFEAETEKTYEEIIEKIRETIIDEESSDFEILSNIADILEDYGIDCGGKYDFG